jgi:hypothetical protein
MEHGLLVFNMTEGHYRRDRKLLNSRRFGFWQFQLQRTGFLIGWGSPSEEASTQSGGAPLMKSGIAVSGKPMGGGRCAHVNTQGRVHDEIALLCRGITGDLDRIGSGCTAASILFIVPSASSTRSTLFLILLAIIVCALLNPGNFGTIDSWQVARSIRLGEPAVTPDDVRQNFGIPGRNGVLQAWYGIGQSLLLLPIDALVDVTVSPLLYRSGLTSTRRKQIAALTIAFLMQNF